MNDVTKYTSSVDHMDSRWVVGLCCGLVVFMIVVAVIVFLGWLLDNRGEPRS